MIKAVLAEPSKRKERIMKRSNLILYRQWVGIFLTNTSNLLELISKIKINKINFDKHKSISQFIFIIFFTFHSPKNQLYFDCKKISAAHKILEQRKIKYWIGKKNDFRILEKKERIWNDYV